MAGESGSPVLPAGLPAPQATPLDEAYWAATARHELVVQQCAACGARQFPPDETCLACSHDTLEWVGVAPRATLHSWTRSWHVTHPALADAGPYVIAVVVPDEAPTVRMWGNLVDPPDGDLPMDAPLEAVFEDHDGYTLVQWRLS